MATVTKYYIVSRTHIHVRHVYHIDCYHSLDLWTLQFLIALFRVQC